jgi:hypothetical protein
MSPEEQKQIWERGKDALERILKHVSVDKVEKLAAKIEDKEFRESFAFKTFMKQLK